MTARGVCHSYSVCDEVGLELDLENGGTLSAFKNGVRLGVIDSGLEGEFCWMGEFGEPGDALAIQWLSNRHSET